VSQLFVRPNNPYHHDVAASLPTCFLNHNALGASLPPLSHLTRPIIHSKPPCPFSLSISCFIACFFRRMSHLVMPRCPVNTPWSLRLKTNSSTITNSSTRRYVLCPILKTAQRPYLEYASLPRSSRNIPSWSTSSNELKSPKPMLLPAVSPLSFSSTFSTLLLLPSPLLLDGLSQLISPSRPSSHLRPRMTFNG